MRYRYIDAHGRERTLEGHAELAAHVMEGKIGSETPLFDARVKRWRLARETEAFRAVGEISPGGVGPGQEATPERSRGPRTAGSTEGEIPDGYGSQSGVPEGLRPTKGRQQGLIWLWFRLDGRIPRWVFLWKVVLPVHLIGSVAGAADIMFGYDVEVELGPIGLVVIPVLGWVWSAGWVKRLHDLDRSGWLVALAWGASLGAAAILIALVVIPVDFVIGIWMALPLTLVWLWYFMIGIWVRGTSGPNQFGPDPLSTDRTDS